MPEQNIKVRSKPFTATKDTFGTVMFYQRGRETHGKHKAFLVQPSDPDLHFAFLSPVVHPVSFYVTCLCCRFLSFGLYIDHIAHIY